MGRRSLEEMAQQYPNGIPLQPDAMPNQPSQAIQPQQAAVVAQQPQGIQQIAPPQQQVPPQPTAPAVGQPQGGIPDLYGNNAFVAASKAQMADDPIRQAHLRYTEKMAGLDLKRGTLMDKFTAQDEDPEMKSAHAMADLGMRYMNTPLSLHGAQKRQLGFQLYQEAQAFIDKHGAPAFKDVTSDLDSLAKQGDNAREQYAKEYQTATDETLKRKAHDDLEAQRDTVNADREANYKSLAVHRKVIDTAVSLMSPLQRQEMQDRIAKEGIDLGTEDALRQAQVAGAQGVPGARRMQAISVMVQGGLSPQQAMQAYDSMQQSAPQAPPVRPALRVTRPPQGFINPAMPAGAQPTGATDSAGGQTLRIPPPPIVPTGNANAVGSVPDVMTKPLPKAQAAIDKAKSDAQAATDKHAKMQVDTGLATDKLEGRVSRAMRATGKTRDEVINSNPAFASLKSGQPDFKTAEYWRANGKEFDALPEAQKQLIASHFRKR